MQFEFDKEHVAPNCDGSAGLTQDRDTGLLPVKDSTMSQTLRQDKNADLGLQLERSHERSPHRRTELRWSWIILKV